MPSVAGCLVANGSFTVPSSISGGVYWETCSHISPYFSASEINKISGSIRSPKTSIRSPTPSAAESQFRDLCRVPNYSELRLLLPSFEGPTMWTKKRISLRRKSYARNMNECWEPRAWRCAKSLTLSYEHQIHLLEIKILVFHLSQHVLLTVKSWGFKKSSSAGTVWSSTISTTSWAWSQCRFLHTSFTALLRKTYINIIDDKHAQWWEAMKFHSFGLRNSEHGNLLLTSLVLSVSIIHDIKKMNTYSNRTGYNVYKHLYIHSWQYLLQ